MKRLLLITFLTGCAAQAADTKAKPEGETKVEPTQTAPAEALGPKAPDFTLSDTDGKQVALHDLLKNGPVILAFFPKAFTGG